MKKTKQDQAHSRRRRGVRVPSVPHAQMTTTKRLPRERLVCLDCGTTENGACAICGVSVPLAGRIPEYFCTICSTCIFDLGVQVCALCGDPESEVCPRCDPEREVCATCGNPCTRPMAEDGPDLVDIVVGVRTYWKEHPLVLESMRMDRRWQLGSPLLLHDHRTGGVLGTSRSPRSHAAASSSYTPADVAKILAAFPELEDGADVVTEFVSLHADRLTDDEIGALTLSPETFRQLGGLALTYVSWVAMHQRCGNPSAIDFNDSREYPTEGTVR